MKNSTQEKIIAMEKVLRDSHAIMVQSKIIEAMNIPLGIDNDALCGLARFAGDQAHESLKALKLLLEDERNGKA